jgi:ribose 5-phosphate isomerase A
MSADREKRAAAETAAMVVKSGMTVGLGTGSTVAFLLPVLARRSLDIRCVATSARTEHDAHQLGLRVETFEDIDRFDVAIDGADQIAPDGWLVKGGGAAHTREKLVAAAAERFVVIADSSKTVAALHGPIPLELLSFGLQATLRRIGPVSLRNVPASPDGGVIADYQGPVDEPAALAGWLTSIPGVVEHGLFPPEMVSTVLVGRGDAVDDIDFVPLGLRPSAPPTSEGFANETPPPQPPNIRISTGRPTGARPDGEGA